MLKICSEAVLYSRPRDTPPGLFNAEPIGNCP
jgi:hypothetical protein